MADTAAWRRASAADLGREIAAGRIDPVELAEAFDEAIAEHPMGTQIYARTTPDRARAEAEAARVRTKAGDRIGPLDGVPISWKDLFDSAGVATESGSRLLEGRTPDQDCEVLRRATAAGTVCLGKTHLSELAFSGLGVNPITATSPNRHGAHLAPGGSSSGAAASMAYDLAPLGIGSDTGGSVRIPAAWNDLVGLKTTWGLIPNTGVVPLAPGLDTVGPLARTVEDAALMFAILADTEVPDVDGQAPADTPLYVPEGLVLEDCAPEVTAGFEGALEKLAQAGCPIARGPLPELGETLADGPRTAARINFETWSEWGPVIDANPGVMFPQIEARFRLGAGIERAAHEEAREVFHRLSLHVQQAIADRGLLAFPTAPVLPPEVERVLADDDYYVNVNLMALRNTRIINLLGLSAITVPTGVPMVGLMLVAGPGGEARLLRAGRMAERALMV